jgi:hypothetical protein
VREQCGACHSPRVHLPEPSRDDDTCLSCHSRYDLNAPGAAHAARTLCLACHGREHADAASAATPRAPVVELGPDGMAPHQDVACLTCHPHSAAYGHAGRPTADCRQCHTRHPEAVTHDAHLSVACEACHLSEVAPVRDAATGQVRWTRQSGHPSRVHVMSAQPDEVGCRRCHTSPNRIGAVAAVLPPKGVICMPCHAAVFTARDAISTAALLALGLGLIGSAAFWFSGARAARADRGMGVTVASRLAAVAQALIWEGLLQRTFFRRAPGRWLLHALIVWPILLRLLWGLAAWAGSRWTPAAAWPWVMLDKNGWANGLFFDLTGLCIIAGAGLAAGFGRREGAAAAMPGMPRPDWVSFGLLGALMLAGFVLEGVRIAMTGYPPGSGWAFAGDALSRLFHRSAGLEDIYRWVWYSHAALTGLFVAWLPFGRMFHIVLAPVLLAVNAWGSSPRPRLPGHGSGQLG